MEDDVEYQRAISTLPKEKGWMFDTQYQYHGFWFNAPTLKGTLIAQKQLYELDDVASLSSTAVLLASHPKTGTTWLKSLLFALTTRTLLNLSAKSHPLLTSNPHDLVPSIEFHAHNHPSNPVPKNTTLLATHVPFHLLPDSIISSTCHRRCIVYVYRDPKDVLISFWHFANRYRRSSKSSTLISIESAVDLFCDGKSTFGPYWDHLLGYWEETQKMPKKRILFVRYEELKSNNLVDWLKKLASFIGLPFSAEEEKTGVVDSIIELCSFKKLKDLEVNKPESESVSMPNFMKMTNDLFFRKAEVGDHRNYLSEEMIARIDKITKMKWGEVGFAQQGIIN